MTNHSSIAVVAKKGKVRVEQSFSVDGIMNQLSNQMVPTKTYFCVEKSYVFDGVTLRVSKTALKICLLTCIAES